MKHLQLKTAIENAGVKLESLATKKRVPVVIVAIEYASKPTVREKAKQYLKSQGIEASNNAAEMLAQTYIARQFQVADAAERFGVSDEEAERRLHELETEASQYDGADYDAFAIAPILAAAKKSGQRIIKKIDDKRKAKGKAGIGGTIASKVGALLKKKKNAGKSGLEKLIEKTKKNDGKISIADGAITADVVKAGEVLEQKATEALTKASGGGAATGGGGGALDIVADEVTKAYKKAEIKKMLPFILLAVAAIIGITYSLSKKQ